MFVTQQSRASPSRVDSAARLGTGMARRAGHDHNGPRSSEGTSAQSWRRRSVRRRAPGPGEIPGQEPFSAVARGGVEPPTYRFSVGRSSQLSYLAGPSGTLPDTPGARDAEAEGLRHTDAPDQEVRGALATPTGLEPAASAVTGRRANQLRYGARSDGAREEHQRGATLTVVRRSSESSAETPGRRLLDPRRLAAPVRPGASSRSLPVPCLRDRMRGSRRGLVRKGWPAPARAPPTGFEPVLPP
jgi:hypothetical protein